MRKFRAWAVVMVMVMGVFALSGCGGGSLDPETSEETALEIPNDVPDTYNTGKVLEGSWRVLDEEYSFSSEYFSFMLNYAFLKFESVDIMGTVTQSKVTSNQDWHAYYTGSTSTYSRYLGIDSLGLDFERETGTMIHQGKDKWRCNVGGTNKIVMNITVLSENTISVNYQGVTDTLYNSMGSEYSFTLTFRKEEYTKP